MDPVHFARVPHSEAAAWARTAIPEQQRNLPLVRGLQIQNYDNDLRSGEIAKGYIIIGTLGCFVKLDGGSTAILSNNHVAAGENLGVIGDRITQPGATDIEGANEIATLTRFVALQPSAPGTSIADGNALLNEIDAALGGLQGGIAFGQG